MIAQEPLRERDSSRLMVLDREDGSITDKSFRDITRYLRAGDCLVLNDTRVLPVRLHGKRETGGRVEVFVLDPGSENPRALIRPSKRVRENETIVLESGIRATVKGRADMGRYVSFNAPSKKVFEKGHMPLPPYISREDNARDKEDYQTVYALKEGATASPTAGLHFTGQLLEEIAKSGVSVAFVTLHTSYGTFAPVKEDNIEEHKMHAEYYEIEKRAADLINMTKNSGGRVFAVGTTSTRVLETAAKGRGKVVPATGKTNLFIYPGYKFKIIDSIITNFHLPESTLLMLTCAFAGKDLIFKAYQKAIDQRYRFFSYGDAMVIV